MTLALQPPIPPMEAQLFPEIPEGPGWQYEPKWDGFRCLVFRDRDEIYLQSKAEKPLTRYFPEIVEAVAAIKARQFVLDGEIVVPVAGRLAFDELLQRIHPAASRIRKLAAERPALLIALSARCCWAFMMRKACSTTSAIQQASRKGSASG
jgi:ATP-dependent DNA ligase